MQPLRGRSSDAGVFIWNSCGGRRKAARLGWGSPCLKTQQQPAPVLGCRGMQEGLIAGSGREAASCLLPHP